MFAAMMLGIFSGGGSVAAAYELGYLSPKQQLQQLRKPRAAPTPSAPLPATSFHPSEQLMGTGKQATPAGTAALAPSSSHHHPLGMLAPPPESVMSKDQFATLTKFGLPSNEHVFVKHGYISSFNTHHRIPNWVMEVFNPETTKAKEADRTSSKFYANKEIPEVFRADNADYSAKHGLSRGHLAAAQFHKDSQVAMDSTFDLSLNTVPQDMTVNGCDWYRLEALTKKLSKEFEHLWVVTGPAFVPTMVAPEIPQYGLPTKRVSYEVVGKHDVAVPTHLFKVVLGEKKDGTLGIGSFLMPNSPILVDQPLSQFMLPRQALESLTGLQFFPQLFHQGNETAVFSGYQGSSKMKGWKPQCFDICAGAKSKCDGGTYGSFSRAYRDVGRLRVTKTPDELEEVYRIYSYDAQSHGKVVDPLIEKEYNAKRKEFGKGTFLME